MIFIQFYYMFRLSISAAGMSTGSQKEQKWVRSLLTNSGSQIIVKFCVYYPDNGIIGDININSRSMPYMNPDPSPLTYLSLIKRIIFDE